MYRFVKDPNKCAKLRNCFAGLYNLDEGVPGVEETVKMACG